MFLAVGRNQLFRGSSALSKSSVLIANAGRDISISSVFRLKEIQKAEEGNNVVIEGKYIPSPREKYLVKELTGSSSPLSILASQTDPCGCCLCKLDLQIKHTDVLILSQFTNSKGKILSNKVTGLCKPQHRRVDYLLVMAEKAGLIDIYDESGIRQLKGWEKFNKYYDETVIDEFLAGTRQRH